MPAISLDYLNKILPKEQQQSIIDSVFGPKMAAVEKAEQTPVEKAEQARRQALSDMFDAYRQRTEQQRTEDIRMAKFNALGNALTTLVQPLGWAIGGKGTGVTGGVQPYDNRQYLEAFNRAVKASDDIRNIANKEDELRFQLAQQDYERERSKKEYEDRARMQAQIQETYAQNQFEREMEKIEKRGEVQMNLAEFKSKNNITNRNRVPVEEKMLSAAWTRYMQEREKYNTDVDRGIVRKRESFPSFEKWLGDEYGWIVKPKGSSGGAVATTQSTTRKPNPMGGSETAAGGKKKNPMN